jgi:F0F1-type ATP synthase membrane subunit b/b'
MRRSILPVAILAGGLGVAGALGAEEHAARGAASPTSLLFPIVNFSIFLYLFFHYAWPIVRHALAQRRKIVEKELSDADRAFQDAKSMRTEVEARRARVQEEGGLLMAQMKAEAERDGAALLEAARQSTERIRRDARMLAEQEAARAAQRVRDEVAEAVVARVAALVRERLTVEDEQRFVGEFVSAVGTGEAP